MEQFGQAIRRKRKELGLSQSVLAKRVGISTNALCSIETGRSTPSPATYDKIFNALGVSPIVFLISPKDSVSAILSKLIDAIKMLLDTQKK